MKRLLVLAAFFAAVQVQAAQLDDSGVKGGLAVVIGCDDAKVIEELGKNERFLVQTCKGTEGAVEIVHAGNARQACFYFERLGCVARRMVITSLSLSARL